jgi:hypothetical protein
MTRAFERRMLNALAVANDAMGRSDFVIWCFEPDKMPAMIDLLIARGRLTEADRSRCVHWTALRDTRGLSEEDSVKVIDADEMLEAAGIRTLTADGWDALVQGMEAFEAFMRDRCGGIDPDERDEYEKLERKARLHRPPRA